jgi:hypothetical protein
LQGGEIIAAWAALAACPRPHGERSFEVPSGGDDGLGTLALEDLLVRRMAHLEFAAGDFCRGDDFKIGNGHEVPDLELAPAEIAKVGVFTRPTPITPRAPWPRITVAVRVRERL